MKTPSFWYRKSMIGRILNPLGKIYAFSTQVRNSFIQPEFLSQPVICIGNAVMGGAGKTPTAIAVTEILKQRGYHPHILSRGYGGKIKNVTRVTSGHTFREVGDEPLLLAQHAPVWVGSDRVQSGERAIQEGADVLVLDDGLQNQKLHKDINLLVIDQSQGVGNGRIFPAGPLRESLEEAYSRSQAVIFIGDQLPSYLEKVNLPIFYAQLKARSFNPCSVIAFAGIGYPHKFQKTLMDLGYEIKEFVSYADHHPYSEKDGEHLLKLSNQYDCPLITTTKDILRLPYTLLGKVKTLEVSLEFEDLAEFSSFLNSSLVVLR